MDLLYGYTNLKIPDGQIGRWLQQLAAILEKYNIDPKTPRTV